ncbi:uncharacterized protein EV422DRAFT_355320 [Fimicolochytrium jonesii]|uniref:uncharacterized protein n=1 Tax=Fimicolochytrium jonesii TaxID=1396493 RepID=UPI0022FE5581|nr:uncharacterized protein EV422DRAFT_355320 [Fimicolochytrium jonesii]KAI8823441.1 hypothetical protein EV422DRAFT_355320 [Fimicolochytrium jonesii]
MDSTLSPGPPGALSKRPTDLHSTRRSSAAALAKLDSITTDLGKTSDWAAGLMVAADSSAALTSSSLGGSSTQIRALLDHAKDIVLQLRTVMEEDSEITLLEDDGRTPSYDTLVTKLSDAFRQQKGINKMNAKLISVNYLVNLANFSRNRQLQQAVAQGQKQVLELQRTVASLEDGVDLLTVEADVQRQTVGRLKCALDSTRSLLESTIVEYRHEMGRQQEVLRKQSSAIGQLYKSRFNQDFILDSGIFLLCIWISNTTLVQMPLKAGVEVLLQQLRFWFPSLPSSASLTSSSSTSSLSSLTSSHSSYSPPPPSRTLQIASKHRIWTHQAAKLALIFFLVRKLRKGAEQYGIHNRVGATYPYLTSVGGMLWGRVARGLGLGVNVPHQQQQEIGWRVGGMGGGTQTVAVVPPVKEASGSGMARTARTTPARRDRGAAAAVTVGDK